MKNIKILILIIIMSFSYIQVFEQSKIVNHKINNNNVIGFNDTLKINIDNKSHLLPEVIKINEDKGFNIFEQMPWIVALIIGFISYMMGRGQIKIQRNLMTSANRQQWINTLRVDISEYLGKIEHYSVIISSAKGDNEKLNVILKDKIQQEIYSLNIKIVLLLNPNEINSNQLIEYLSNYTISVFDQHDDELKQQEIKQKILDVTKLILKIEWERVKKSK